MKLLSVSLSCAILAFSARPVSVSHETDVDTASDPGGGFKAAVAAGQAAVDAAKIKFKGESVPDGDESVCNSGKKTSDNKCQCVNKGGRTEYESDCCSGAYLSVKRSDNMCGCIAPGGALEFGARAGNCCTKTAVDERCVCAEPGEEVFSMMQPDRDCCARDTAPGSKYCASHDISGTYELVQVKTGRYMDAYLKAKDVDWSLVTRDAQEDHTQNWIFTRVGPGDDHTSGIYTIQQKENNRYMDAHLVEDKDWDVVTRGEQENDTQKWIVTATAEDGVYTIQQKENKRYLDAHSDSNDHRVVTREKQNDESQKWRLTKL